MLLQLDLHVAEEVLEGPGEGGEGGEVALQMPLKWEVKLPMLNVKPNINLHHLQWTKIPFWILNMKVDHHQHQGCVLPPQNHRYVFNASLILPHHQLKCHEQVLTAVNVAADHVLQHQPDNAMQPMQMTSQPLDRMLGMLIQLPKMLNPIQTRITDMLLRMSILFMR